MKSEVLLCSTPLAPGQPNTYDFPNEETQRNYFKNELPGNTFLVEVNTKIDGFLESITVDIDHRFVRNFDYAVVYDYKDNYRPYYFFITGMEMATRTATTIYLKCDVMQTYMFMYELKESFVDRCHVPRWIDNQPTRNNIDEGLEYGSTMILDRELVHKMENTYILATTTPIGKTTATGGGGGGGGDTGADCLGDITKGIPSRKLFRYLKGIEGLQQYPRNIGDGQMTYGYGVTKANEPSYYDKLGNPPVSEETASKVLFELVPERYGSLVKNQMINDGIDLSKVPINVFDAFVDLTYNSGYYNSRLYKAWKNGESMDAIYNDWLTYAIMPGTIFEEGLRRRRKEEAEMFKNGNYIMSPINIMNGQGSYTGVVDGDGYFPTCGTDLSKFITISNDYGENWIVPVEGTVSATYPTYPSGSPHDGLDIACAEGTPVHVSKDGTCIKRRELTTSYGKYLFIDHGNDLITIYAHNSELLINEGDQVKAGQVIAKSGNTGNSKGAHCHFELRYKNSPVNVAPSLHVGDVIKYPN